MDRKFVTVVARTLYTTATKVKNAALRQGHYWRFGITCPLRCSCNNLWDINTATSLRWPQVDASWNVMAQAQKPDLVFRRNWRVHLNRRGRQFSRLLAAEVCASAVVMLDTPCSEVVWRVLATHSIRQFPLHFPSRASPCAISYQLESNTTFRRMLSK
jgi:hypothetical protein